MQYELPLPLLRRHVSHLDPPFHYQGRPALSMFELIGRTGPPISGGRRFGEEKIYVWLKYFIPLL